MRDMWTMPRSKRARVSSTDRPQRVGSGRAALGGVGERSLGGRGVGGTQFLFFSFVVLMRTASDSLGKRRVQIRASRRPAGADGGTARMGGYRTRCVGRNTGPPLLYDITQQFPACHAFIRKHARANFRTYERQLGWGRVKGEVRSGQPRSAVRPYTRLPAYALQAQRGETPRM